MYAVIRSGGHQYRVEKGQVITVDKMLGEVGENVVFPDVLALSNEKGPIFGTPLVAGAQVKGIIKFQKRSPKVLVFKYKRRKNHKKMRGHKQPITLVEITDL